MTASRILVVDDEADIRGLLKEILSEEGYEVEVAADATQARSSRATQVPDLVLLDIWMPDTDGITLLREWSVTDGYDCPVVQAAVGACARTDARRADRQEQGHAGAARTGAKRRLQFISRAAAR